MKPEMQTTHAAGILTTSRVALALDEIQLERGVPEVIRPEKRLNFRMQGQQQSQWCWAATAASIADYYRSSWRQCDLVNQELQRQNCCANGADPQCNQPWYLENALQRVGHLYRWVRDIPPRVDYIKEIDAGRPLGVRVQWRDGNGHFPTVTGYRRNRSPFGGNYIYFDDPLYGRSSYTERSAKTSYHGSGTWTTSYFTKP